MKNTNNNSNLNNIMKDVCGEALLAFSFNKMMPAAPWCAFIATFDKNKKPIGVNGYSYSSREEMISVMTNDFDAEAVETAINHSRELSISKSDAIMINNFNEYEDLVEILSEILQRSFVNA